MNEQTSTEWIDEAELRAALQPWQTDPERFADGVRQRIEQAELQLPAVNETDRARMAESDWLETAAAVIPVPLLSHGAGSSLVKLGQLSLGKKLVAWAALPATGLLLMVAASIWAIIKIRRAQRDKIPGDVDAIKLAEATAAWWKQFGLAIPVIGVIMLLLMLTGHAMPVFIIFLVSGTTMVGLISRLGKAGLVDRRTVAGALAPGLLILVQLTHTSTMLSHGYPFLDQMLVPTVLLLGGMAITIVCNGLDAKAGVRSWMLWSPMLWLPMLLLVGWFSGSLWNPVSKQDLKSFAEEFDYAKFSSASWEQWQVTTQWLQDSNVPLDLSKPHALLQTELAKAKPNPWILCYAMEADLFDEADLARVRDLDEMKKRLLDSSQQGRRFISVGYEPRFIIRALVMRDELNDSQRDMLGERLKITMEDLKTKNFGRLLQEQLDITKLAALIERPIDIDSFRDFVHETLVSHQCLGYRLGTPSGGFTMSTKLKFGNEFDTAAAIELMQIYGVPPAVRIDALRSYLRPSANDKWSGLQARAYIRQVSLERMNSLPTVEPITWIDYFRYEQNLIMAILFTLVCVFATWGAAKVPSPPRLP